jgi:hypothetical protein
MKTPFCCDATRDLYKQYYADQQTGRGSSIPIYSGTLHQRGFGLPVYSGVLSQRGYGIGSFFKSLFVKALPFLQRTAAAALRTGAQVFDDVREGKKIKESLKQRVPETIKDVGMSIFNQKGSGLRKRKKKRTLKHKKNKKRRRDVFS